MQILEKPNSQVPLKNQSEVFIFYKKQFGKLILQETRFLHNFITKSV